MEPLEQPRREASFSGRFPTDTVHAAVARVETLPGALWRALRSVPQLGGLGTSACQNIEGLEAPWINNCIEVNSDAL